MFTPIEAMSVWTRAQASRVSDKRRARASVHMGRRERSIPSQLLASVRDATRPHEVPLVLGLDRELARWESLSCFWGGTYRADWMLWVLDRSMAHAARRVDDRDLRLFACWSAEQVGGCPAEVKAVLRGEAAPASMGVVHRRLVSGAAATCMSGAMLETFQRLVRAGAANGSALSGATAAAHYLRMYCLRRPVATRLSPVPTRLALARSNDAARRRRARPRRLRYVIALQVVAADALRAFVGNPFSGSGPNVAPEVVAALLQPG